MRVNTEQSIPNQEHHLCERVCGLAQLTRPFCRVTTRSQGELLCDLFLLPCTMRANRHAPAATEGLRLPIRQPGHGIDLICP